MSLTIEWAATVSVVVYSLLGRTVAVLAKGRLEAGTHLLSFKDQPLSAGMYFVRASVNGSFLTERMLVK